MFRIVIAALAAALFSTTAAAQRQPVPIVNYTDVEIVTSTGQPVSLAAFDKAAVAAAEAASRGREKWTVGRIAPDRLRLTCNVEGNKHVVAVDVPVKGKTYSMLYAESTNMKYQLLNGQPVIHPFYNRWVEAMKRSLDAELRKL